MKKLSVIGLILMILCCACSASAQETGYKEPTLLDFSDLIGLDTHYSLYDRDYYEAPDDHAGTVVKIKYTTSQYGEKTYKKTMNVYLPYGYDENGEERYPVIYFFHGRGCDPDTLIKNEFTKNAIDHMISTGVAKPFILVAPTYYYDARHLLYDLDRFYEEISPYLNRFDIPRAVFDDLLLYQRSVLRVPNDSERTIKLKYDVHGFLSDAYVNNIHPLVQKTHELVMRDSDVMPDWPSFGKYVIWYGRMGWASYKDDVKEM